MSLFKAFTFFVFLTCSYVGYGEEKPLGDCSLTGEVASSKVTCFGAENGTIEISSLSGGSGVYEASIDGGESWQSVLVFDDVPVGSYHVMVRDANQIACSVTLDAEVEIAQPAELGANLEYANLSCHNEEDGEILLSDPVGGSGSFGFSIDGGVSWQTEGVFSGLSPAVYDVMVKDMDDENCVKTLNDAVVLSRPDPLNAIVSSSNINCYGASTGEISFTAPSGGSGVYEYSIDAGATWQSNHVFSGLSANEYQLSMRDKNAPTCIKNFSAIALTQPNQLDADVSFQNALCHNTASGKINIHSPSGGGGAYQYSINGGESWRNSGDFNTVPHGNYHIMIRDAATVSCSQTLNPNLEIGQPEPLDAGVTVTEVDCFGEESGKIEFISPEGGSGNYEFSIGSGWQSSGLFEHLSAGTYQISVRDAEATSCLKVLDSQIKVPTVAELTASLSSKIVICYGEETGQIRLSNASGGSGTYRYSINGGETWFPDGLFDELPGGFYQVLLGDAENQACVKVMDDALHIVELEELNATVYSENSGCNGVASGVINISNPTGGGEHYQYSIDGGENWQMSGSYTNLPAGTYDVMMRDAVVTSCVKMLQEGLVVEEPDVLDGNVSVDDVLCNGGSTGSIAVDNLSGGSGSYEFSNDGGLTWQVSSAFDNLSAGSYKVSIRDAENPGCRKVLQENVTVSEPEPLSAGVSSSNINCFDESTGNITFSSPSGGIGVYEFSIDGDYWQESMSFEGLSAGVYSLAMRDEVCTYSFDDPVEILQPEQLSATINPIHISCYGGNNGKILFTDIAGGGGTYQFSKDGGESWQSVAQYNDLQPGVYNIHIRDGVTPACRVVLDEALEIKEVEALSASVAKDHVSCYGEEDGSISFHTISGGSGEYEFSINEGVWVPGAEFSDLPSGEFAVNVRDANDTSCVLSLGLLDINAPEELSASVDVVEVNCFGTNSGAIHFSMPTGGSGAYEYSVDNGQHWQEGTSFENLAAGNYTVYIRDKNEPGCQRELEVVSLSQPEELAAVVDYEHVDCYEGESGQIVFSSPTGGSGVYEYSVNGTDWQSSGIFPSLGASVYTPFIRDAENPACQIGLGNVELSQPSVLNGSVEVSPVTCDGGDNGSLLVSDVSGGSGSYEFSIGEWQSSNEFMELEAGAYEVFLRDEANPSCSISLGSYEITAPEALSVSLSSSDNNCYGGNEGSIAVNVSGGSGSYQFSVDNGNSWQEAAVFEGLPAGIYNQVFVRDAEDHACMTEGESTVIAQPEPMTAEIEAVEVNCFGTNSGAIHFSMSTGGSGAYEYSVDNGQHWQEGTSFENLEAGNYTVYIRDKNEPGCQRELEVVSLSQPEELAAVVDYEHVGCYEGETGQIVFTSPTGGSGVYVYSVNGTDWQSSGIFPSLGASVYTPFIRDAENPACQIGLGNVELSQPSVLNGSVEVSPVTCDGGDNGSLLVSDVSGGSGSYEFSIGEWQSSNEFMELEAGAYEVFLRDEANPSCSISLGSYEVTAPEALSVSLSSSDNNCYGGNEGSIAVNVSGGSGSYQFSVDNGNYWQEAAVFEGLPAGIYNQVLVRDAEDHACMAEAESTVIAQPEPMAAEIEAVEVNCFGTNSGAIHLSMPTGGSGAYEYSVDNGQHWQEGTSFENLAAGNYTVYVRDGNLNTCERKLGSVTIASVDALEATVEVKNSTCNGVQDGEIIIVDPVGGSGVFEYSTDGGNSWGAHGNFNDLAPAEYQVAIRDASNTACVRIFDPVVVSQPQILNASVNQVNATCYGGDNGQVVFENPSGGSGNYEYSIDGGDTWNGSPNFSNISAGNFVAVIRDAEANNCARSLGSFGIEEPEELSFSVEYFPLQCYGEATGVIEINPSGGSGKYEFSLDGGETWGMEPVHANLSAGAYTVNVRDAKNQNCYTSPETVSLVQPEILSGDLEVDHVNCHGAAEGAVSVLASSGGSGSFKYSIDGGSNWQASNHFSGLNAGNYEVLIADADVSEGACYTSLGEIEVEAPEALHAEVVSNHINCFEGSDGAIEFLSLSGGSGAYEFSIDGKSSWATSDFADLEAGDYEVWIRDANFNTCQSSLGTYSLHQPEKLSATVEVEDVSCNGLENGMISLSNITGGSGTFEFNIDGEWLGEQEFKGLTLGSYEVEIRDAENDVCQVSLGVFEVAEPEQLSASVEVVDIPCEGGEKGEISFTSVSGGSFNYGYSIDGGEAWQGEEVFEGLSPGAFNLLIRDEEDKECQTDLGEYVVNSYELHANITSTAVTCLGAENGEISVMAPSGGSGQYEFSLDGLLWSPYGTFEGLASGAYTVYMRDPTDHACIADFSGNIVREPEALSANVEFSGISCHGYDDGLISVVSPQGGSGQYRYSIDGGANWSSASSFSGLEPGNYQVHIKDASDASCFEILKQSISLEEPEVVQATVLSNNASGCEGNSNGEIEIGDVSGGVPPYMYSVNGSSWAEYPIFENLSGGTYSVQIRDASGCSYILEDAYELEHIDLVSAPKIAFHPANQRVCEGGGAVFSVDIEEGAGDVTWQWFAEGLENTDTLSGLSQSELVVEPVLPELDSTVFYLMVTGDCGVAYSDTVMLNVDRQEPALVTGGNSYCIDEKVDSLQVVGTFTSVLHWEYADATDLAFEEVDVTDDRLYPYGGDQDGTVIFRAYVQNGNCAPFYTEPAYITYFPDFNVSAGMDTSIISGGSVQLQATGGVSYQWEDHESLNNTSVDNPIASPKETTVFSVEVADTNGCFASAEVTVFVEELHIPNTFTPNGDGVNDVWRIRNIHFYPEASIEIFNRWGVILYRESGVFSGWDGRSNGAEMPAGTYYYTLKTAPGSEPVSGFITIVR
ncbi:gliding motility-associated C-terminal domain-containing protein [Cytophagaceae bacterium ABcell3]|nr:gliding motility-associated C-terminal domain-containing protein [Cytophagaceae bacterium ABcell3]